MDFVEQCQSTLFLEGDFAVPGKCDFMDLNYLFAPTSHEEFRELVWDLIH